MKTFYLCFLSFLIIPISPLTGQCIADAGPDQVACVGIEGIDPIELGANPTVLGGTPPYTYTWDALYVLTIGPFTISMTASDFLNDTTFANPTIISWIEEEDLVEFHLTVTDAENIVCRDTTLVKFSNYTILLGYLNFNIQQGESIYLSFGTNIGGGIPPYEYLWRPNHGLLDSTSLSFWAKPDHSIAYYVSVTDSAGCSIVGPNFYYINVTPVSIAEQIPGQIETAIFPNPCHDFLSFVIPGEEMGKIDIGIYDTKSRLLINEMNLPYEFSINVSTLNPGLYIYKIKESDLLLDIGTFVVDR